MYQNTIFIYSSETTKPNLKTPTTLEILAFVAVLPDEMLSP